MEIGIGLPNTVPGTEGRTLIDWARQAEAALGPDARAQADGYLHHYYGWLGDIAGMIAAGAAVSAEMVRSYAAAFKSAGCDEIIFVPTASSLDQIALLAEAVA